MRRPSIGVGVLLALLMSPAAGEDADVHPPDLRLLPVEQGVREAVVRGDLSRLPQAAIQKLAEKVGVDLAAPPQSHVVRRRTPGRLFYVFYKVAENAFGDRPYLIQRIKRTERNWKHADADPEVEVTYQVEVFKVADGALKRPDQHHGSYGMHGFHRREIVKEYEIGFGRIPGLVEGTTWPFDPGILFKYVYRYGPSPDVYDRVEWIAARPWTLSVSLDADGAYRIASPELGFDLPDAPPPEEGAASPGASPATPSDVVVLHAGRGPAGLVVGKTTIEELHAARGEPIDVEHPTPRSQNHHYADGLTFNFNGAGILNTVFSRPGFEGSTDRGIRQEDTRGRVIDVMGPPPDQKADASYWHYDGIAFWFDGTHRVDKIVVFRR
jgi:hypothetical protein